MVSNQSVLAYCSLSLGLSMLSSAFNFYYIKIFLNHYMIEESWFHISQTLYLLWNAINDPLFAVLQDNTNSFLTRTRREGILYTAPVFGVVFLIPWFQFGTAPWAVGVHLIVALFLYDTLFTFVGLLACCIFTELASDTQSKLRLTRWSVVAGMLGSQSIVFLEYCSSSLTNFAAFQRAAICVAFFSTAAMLYAGLNAHTKYDMQAQRADAVIADKANGCKKNETKTQSDSFWRQMFQLFREQSFISFVFTNFLQEFHRAFLGSFLVIICDYLVTTEQVPLHVRSFFYGMTGTCGSLFLIFVSTPLVAVFGYFRVIRYNFVWKVLAGVIMYVFIGRSSAWLIMLFFLLDRTYANATFSLFNMPLSDIADKDKEKYQRKHPISSTVFGSNALVVKPSQSLCPMLIVSILNRYGYEHLKKGSGSEEEVEALKEMMFQLMCFLPLVVGLIQYLVWSQYNIRQKTVNIEHIVIAEEA